MSSSAPDADGHVGALATTPDPRWSRGLLEMAMAASVIVLLPLLYASILTIFGLILLVQGDQGMEDLAMHRGPVWVAVVRLACVTLGAGWWLLMFKPLLVRRPRKPDSQEIRKIGQKALFDLIAGICRMTGASVPGEVRVDCDITVRANLIHGLWSLPFQKTRLTIGLPLVANLSASELAGALANELGRYPQGLYGRLAHMVRGMNDWLSWVALSLNPWEQALASAKVGPKKKSSLLVKAWRAFVWVSQRPIWMIMWIARIVSIRALRRMVTNGDRCEAIVIGSAAANEALQKIPHLQSAWLHACRLVQSGLESGRLPDNFPQTVARHSASVKATAESISAWDKGSIFSPATSVRAKALEKLNLPGALSAKGNGAVWVGEFTELSRQVTHGHYQRDLQLQITQFRLVGPDEAGGVKKAQNGQAPVKRYFKGLLHPERALCGEGPSAAPAGATPAIEAYRAAIVAGVDWIQNRGDQMKATLREWQLAWQRIRDLEMAHAYALAGLPMDSHQYGVLRHDAAMYREEITRQQMICEFSEDPLLIDEGCLESRFAAALGLLWETPVSRLPMGLVPVRESLPSLAELYQVLGSRMASMRGLMTFAGAFESLGIQFSGGATDGDPAKAIQFLVPRLMHHSREVLSGLDRIPCPSQCSVQASTLSEYLLGHPSSDALTLLTENWQARDASTIGQKEATWVSEIVPPLMDRFMELYYQTFSALASAAELVEMHLIDAHSEESSVKTVSHQESRVRSGPLLVPATA